MYPISQWCSFFVFLLPTKMSSSIQKRFEDSVQQVFREHFIGNMIKKRWELRPKNRAKNKNKILLTKLRLVLSWRMGITAFRLTPRELMFHIIEEYKKINHEGYLIKKYG